MMFTLAASRHQTDKEEDRVGVLHRPGPEHRQSFFHGNPGLEKVEICLLIVLVVQINHV